MPGTVIAFICSACILGFSKERDTHATDDIPGVKLSHKNPHGSETTTLSFLEAEIVSTSHGKTMV